MSSRRVLLLEGDPGIRDSLAEILHADDDCFEAVDKSFEALERLRHSRYDLLVAAAGTNGNGGIKLLRRIEAVCPETRVILTGERNPERAVAAIRARAFAYVHRPVKPTHFRDIVQQALDSSSWRADIRILSSRPEWVTLEVRCRLEAAERATHLVRELEADLEPNTCEDLTVAFRELLLNGIEHGGKSNPKKRVRVSLLRAGGRLLVHMRDPGRGFAMNELQHAAVGNPEGSPTRHIEIRHEHGQRPGGFGILMASKLVDSLIYNERGNEVVFVKALTSRPATAS